MKMSTGRIFEKFSFLDDVVGVPLILRVCVCELVFSEVV